MENDTTLEDSMEEHDKDHTSGDEGTTEETNDEEKHEDGNGDDDEDEGESEEELSEFEYSESEESDPLDVGETEDRRQKYVIDMSELEKQFAELKEQLYEERLTQIEDQLKKVHKMEAKEYTGPLQQLEQDCKSRCEVAGYLKHYKTVNLENQLQCELQSAEQHFANEESELRNSLISEYEEKLRKVEEERHTAEMYSDLWCDESFRSRKKLKGVPNKRKKPVTVTGPYIIYMLNEMDILEDWAAIRKAKKKAAELDCESRI